MNLIKHAPFLNYVQDYIKANPEVGAYVADYVAGGIEASRKEVLHRAADMEVALVTALQRRKGWIGLVLDKLHHWNGRTSLRWDATISDLEKRK